MVLLLKSDYVRIEIFVVTDTVIVFLLNLKSDYVRIEINLVGRKRRQTQMLEIRLC